MKTALKTASFISIISVLSGCASLSGFDASSDFSCKAQPGVSCQSISGTYQNAKAKNLPSQQPNSHLTNLAAGANNEVDESQAPEPIMTKTEYGRAITGKAPSAGTPLFQAPIKLRVWFSPWEDKNQTLHDQSYSYLIVQKSRWQIEHYKQQQSKSSFSLSRGK